MRKIEICDICRMLKGEWEIGRIWDNKTMWVCYECMEYNRKTKEKVEVWSKGE